MCWASVPTASRCATSRPGRCCIREDSRQSTASGKPPARRRRSTGRSTSRCASRGRPHQCASPSRDGTRRTRSRTSGRRRSIRGRGSSTAPRRRRGDVWNVIDSGPPEGKVDLLVLGEGYTQAEMKKFHGDVRRLVDALFAQEPFRSRRGDFNVRAIDTPSAASGTGSRARARAVPLHAAGDALQHLRLRALRADARTGSGGTSLGAAPYDFVLVLVNERTVRRGRDLQLYSTAAAASAFAPYLVVHEFGHHFAGLGDEYYTSDVACGLQRGEDRALGAEHHRAAQSGERQVEGSRHSGTPCRPRGRRRLRDAVEGVPGPAGEPQRFGGAGGGAGGAVPRGAETFEEKLLKSGPHGAASGPSRGAMYEARGCTVRRRTASCSRATRSASARCAGRRSSGSSIVNEMRAAGDTREGCLFP